MSNPVFTVAQGAEMTDSYYNCPVTSPFTVMMLVYLGYKYKKLVKAMRYKQIPKQFGNTPSERYLANLCEHTFLSLWSYPNLYRDQRATNKTEGKELCDLLVIFDNHILVFSVKHCNFPNKGTLETDWRRWLDRAVLKSVKQVNGAARWIKSYPDRIFLDRACTQRFPVEIPPSEEIIFHRIVVALGSARSCAEHLGGSGSLMLANDNDTSIQPFLIGKIGEEFIHVFDDTSLEIVLGTLDTISDFVPYLAKKEELFTFGPFVFAAGEEELLGQYLLSTDSNNQHYFFSKDDLSQFSCINIPEGHWQSFLDSPQRKEQREANKVSYVWDDLIERFNSHLLNDTLYYSSSHDLSEAEKVYRFLAREKRTRRRVLGRSLFEMIATTPRNMRRCRVLWPSDEGDPYYIFLLLPRPENVPYSEYCKVRRKYLEAYCKVAKLDIPDAELFVGVATESGNSESRSEDLLFLDLTTWDKSSQEEAIALREDLGLLTDYQKHHSTEYEYPIETDHHTKR